MKMELAPARKASACASRGIASRPALSRTIARGIRMRATAIARIQSNGSSLGWRLQGRAVDRHQGVDRHALRLRIEVGQRVQQPDPVELALAHAEDAAAADRDAGLGDVGDGAQPVLVGARGDDVAVVVLRRVEVVVVGGQPGFGEPARLVLGQHAERAAGLHAERADTATISSTRSKARPSVTSRQAAPMQKRGARLARVAGRASTSSVFSIRPVSTPVS